jgi:hypothetical protein
MLVPQPASTEGNMSRRHRFALLWLLMATAVLSFPAAMIADAVGLGNAGPFAVLHLGCGSGSHGQLKVNTGTVAAGDVGIGAGATDATDPFGFGKFQRDPSAGRSSWT